MDFNMYAETGSKGSQGRNVGVRNFGSKNAAAVNIFQKQDIDGPFYFKNENSRSQASLFNSDLYNSDLFGKSDGYSTTGN